MLYGGNRLRVRPGGFISLPSAPAEEVSRSFVIDSQLERFVSRFHTLRKKVITRESDGQRMRKLREKRESNTEIGAI